MVVTKRHKKVPESLKSKILEASLVPGCRVADLAKTHGVAAWTIYTWRKAATAKSGSKNTTSSSSKATINHDAVASPSNKFIELSVENIKDSHLEPSSSIIFPRYDNPSSNSTLQKASLTFKHFSFIVEGKITPSTLLKIIKAIDREVLL